MSGISFLCWNNALNGVLFQLFSLYWILGRYGAAPDRKLDQESEKAIVHGIGIVQIVSYSNYLICSACNMWQQTPHMECGPRKSHL